MPPRYPPKDRRSISYPLAPASGHPRSISWRAVKKTNSQVLAIAAQSAGIVFDIFDGSIRSLILVRRPNYNLAMEMFRGIKQPPSSAAASTQCVLVAHRGRAFQWSTAMSIQDRLRSSSYAKATATFTSKQGAIGSPPITYDTASHRDSHARRMTDAIGNTR